MSSQICSTIAELCNSCHQVIGGASEDAASIAEEAVEAAAAATVPVRLQQMWRQADGLHKPFGLVFASAHVLGTACALTGARNVLTSQRMVWQPCRQHDANA